MLTLFEDITYDLTDYEMEVLVPMFVQSFLPKIGKGNAITNKQIILKLKGRDIKITDPRVRKIINYVRRKDLVPGLIASSKGYYVSQDPLEVQDYVNSLEGRANEIWRIRDCMKDYLRTLS
jgi:hypothetical protein